MTGRIAKRERVRVRATDTEGRSGTHFVDAACFGALGVTGGVATHPVTRKIVPAHVFVHRDTGRFLLPASWFFETREEALSCLGAILDRLVAEARTPAMREAREDGEISLRALRHLGPVFLGEARKAGVIAGPFHELRQLGDRLDIEASNRAIEKAKREHAEEKAKAAERGLAA